MDKRKFPTALPWHYKTWTCLCLCLCCLSHHVALAVHKHDDVYLVVALVAPVVALVVALAVYKHEHLCLALTGRFARKVGLGGKNQ